MMRSHLFTFEVSEIPAADEVIVIRSIIVDRYHCGGYAGFDVGGIPRCEQTMTNVHIVCCLSLTLFN